MTKPPASKLESSNTRPICGIIMPISGMPPEYEASHWSDVRKILDVAINKAGMTPQIVSDSFESDVIQQRIISNLYENPVVICDVSGLNPNVMFELGMRITFKKPVIIITDDFSSIPFDTKVIEHLGYPKNLHIHQTNEFILKLAEKIEILHKKSLDGTFKSFIEAFGTFEILEPTKKIVEADQLILDKITELQQSLRQITRTNANNQYFSQYASTNNKIIEDKLPIESNIHIDFSRETDEREVSEAIEIISNLVPKSNFKLLSGPKGQATIVISNASIYKELAPLILQRLKHLPSRPTIRY